MSLPQEFLESVPHGDLATLARLLSEKSALAVAELPRPDSHAARMG